MDCIFCKIINKEVNSVVVHKDKTFIAFKDINPKAPVHILVIPRQHIPSINHLAEDDKVLIGGLILTAQKITEKLGIKNTGYKLAFNVGEGGGQVIEHLHLHILGGWETKEKMHKQKIP